MSVAAAATMPDPPPSDRNIVVYLLDHQLLPAAELDIIQTEIDRIFRDADLSIAWLPNESPRRTLLPNELRVIILPSDGTRWFHGPSNVIGIAPHDAEGIGRNCFVFYHQALWFRQQAMSRCREALQARTEAETRGVAVDPYIDAMAPPDCGDRLLALTAKVVARAAAHEMVHILLNKLDHSNVGLMRLTFDVNDWMFERAAPFRLGDEEVAALQTVLSVDAGVGAR